ncbi:MAG TPA: hypothetical protein VHR47_04985 [Bacillota bacterium]|nr:hypothetical protein [Bacillota bacterium]
MLALEELILNEEAALLLTLMVLVGVKTRYRRDIDKMINLDEGKKYPQVGRHSPFCRRRNNSRPKY